MRKKHGFYLVVGLIVVCSLTNCGGSSSNTPALLSIQLSPAAPSLVVNSSILISAQTTPPLPKYTGTFTWSIPSQPNCTEVVVNPQEAPPLAGCPTGWLAWEPPLTGYTPTGVYYYSPATAGSYQVNVQGQITDQSINPTVEYQGSASATVTVTAQ